MSSDIAISVRNLSKTYRIFGHPGDRIKQALTLGRVPFHQEFTALKDVSFEIKKGEIVGIIGRNGSGKSTLLQLLCGILKPSAGSATINGRIAALLELGAGFNPEFTGRENVYFQGALMGFTKRQMDERFDDIAAFADIGEFIDQPVRMYSSGMFVRLAFSVAISICPDILIVDEALAVGDSSFQAKCFRRIQDMRDCGGTVLFVTHATDQVIRLCNRALLIDGGMLVGFGTPKDIVNRYFERIFQSPIKEVPAERVDQSESAFHLRKGYRANEYRFGSREAEITDFRLTSSESGFSKLRFLSGSPITLAFQVVFHRVVKNATFAMSISTLEGITLFGVNSRDNYNSTAPLAFLQNDTVEARFSLKLHLAQGDYLVSLSVSEDIHGHLEPLDRRYEAIFISIDNPLKLRGFVDLQPEFSLSEAPLVGTRV